MRAARELLNSSSLAALDRSPHLDALREEVRDFLATELAAGAYTRDAAGWDRYDPAFSGKVGSRGWIGMTWPRAYGGRERTALERYVVTEELLAAGAPVRAHWLADRQFGPLLLAFGTEEQKRKYLPRIAAGECYVCVGMSEADCGSDLASIRTKATRVEGGWKITGTKLWTSYAHKAHFINLFARTSARSDTDRHAGITQFIIDLRSDGISINPIINLAGDHDFNEVVFDDVFAFDCDVIGTVGEGWKQASGELAYERSGPERWLSSYGLLVDLIDCLQGSVASAAFERVGRLVSHIWTLHHMSFAIAGALQKGEAPDVTAALVKDLGNQFDQDVPEAARLVMAENSRASLPGENRFCEKLDRALLYAPSYSIRGGTREILRGIIARGLGLR